MNRSLRIILMAVGAIIICCSGTGIKSGYSPFAIDDPDPCFLVVSDVHLHKGENQLQAFKRSADAGDDEWEFAKKKLFEVCLHGVAGHTKPRFIIYLGDLPLHDAPPDTTMESAGQVLKDLRELSEKAGIPLIYVPGNNDSPFGDYKDFSISLFNHDKGCNDKCWPLIKVNAEGKSNGAEMVEGSQSIYEETGCYSAYPIGFPLRVVVLNTTAFTPDCSHTNTQKKYAEKTLLWLEDQLSKAQAAEEKVLIAMHVPPGIDGHKKLHPKDNEPPTCQFFWDSTLHFANNTVQNSFLDITSKYSDKIVGMISSHTHLDGIRKLNDLKGNFSNLLISIPSIAPGHGNNPAFQLITYDADDFYFKNFITLYADYKDKEEAADWKDGKLDFKEILGDKRNISLKRAVGKADDNELLKAVMTIYDAGRKKADKEEVELTLKVDKQ